MIEEQNEKISNDDYGVAKLSCVLGIISLISFMTIIVPLILAPIGLSMGNKIYKKTGSYMAKIGRNISLVATLLIYGIIIIAILVGIANMILGGAF